NPARIALIGQQRPKAPSPGAGLAAAAGVDPRCLALNHGSRVFLETLNAWPPNAAEIRQVHVSQRQRLGRVIIDHRDLQAPRLGDVVRYDDLLDTLQSALEHSGVTRIDARALPRLSGQHVDCRYEGGSVSARLAVQSDGARPAGLERQ